MKAQSKQRTSHKKKYIYTHIHKRTIPISIYKFIHITYKPAFVMKMKYSCSWDTKVTGISKTSVSYIVVIKNCKHYNYANNLKIHFNRIYYSVFSSLLSYQKNDSVKIHTAWLSMTYYLLNDPSRA